jgi:hypothetical protein
MGQPQAFTDLLSVNNLQVAKYVDGNGDCKQLLINWHVIISLGQYLSIGFFVNKTPTDLRQIAAMWLLQNKNTDVVSGARLNNH